MTTVEGEVTSPREELTGGVVTQLSEEVTRDEVTQQRDEVTGGDIARERRNLRSSCWGPIYLEFITLSCLL